MTIWIVTVGNRINSVWADKGKALAHITHLIEVNGDQIAVKARDFEVRA